MFPLQLDPQPISFIMTSIVDLIADATIAANVKSALYAYGAAVEQSNVDLANEILAQVSWCGCGCEGGRGRSGCWCWLRVPGAG